MKWENAKITLRAGLKITRPNWEAEHFWVMSEDGYERILCHNGDHARVHLQQVEADDWEVWIEEKRIKCFWCERYVTNIVEHTNDMHPRLSPRSYDFIKEKRC